MGMKTEIAQQEQITDDVLAAGLEAMRGQITLVMKRSGGDDLTKRVFESALLSLESLAADINLRLDQDVVDYNGIVDQFEAYQADVNNQLIEIGKLFPDVENISIKQFAQVVSTQIEDLQVKVKFAENKTEAAMLVGEELRRTFNKYKKDYPESLVATLRTKERENGELKKERRELKEELSTLGKDMRSLRKSNVQLQADNLARAKDIQRYKDNEASLRDTLDDYSGIKDKVHCFDITSTGGTGGFGYIYSYPFGLAADVGRRGEVILTARFHFQIRTSHLLAMDVIPTIWGAPLYNRLKDFEADWNPEIDQELHQRIMSKLEKKFPKLHKRISDSKEAHIDELKMRPGTLVALKTLGFNTVFNVASIPSTFMPSIPELDKEMDEEIVASVRMWASKWDRENGGVEELYGTKNTVTGQVHYRVRN
jgi:hypothetical protein